MKRVLPVLVVCTAVPSAAACSASTASVARMQAAPAPPVRRDVADTALLAQPA